MPPADLAPSHAARFASALLDPDRPRPDRLGDHAARPAGRRYDVYRNNVAVGLAEALAAAFPVVARLVGEAFFRNAALAYLRRHPPTSRLVVDHGAGFADFLAGFEPARALPYLPDVARLERARLVAYHAADAAPFGEADLAAVPTERLNELQLAPHPATTIVASPFAIVSIVEAHRTETVERVEVGRAETALVTRPALEVEIRRLPPGGAAFFSALAGGAFLSGAAEMGLEAETNFDLAAALAALTASGAFVAQRGENGHDRPGQASA